MPPSCRPYYTPNGGALWDSGLLRGSGRNRRRESLVGSADPVLRHRPAPQQLQPRLCSCCNDRRCAVARSLKPCHRSLNLFRVATHCHIKLLVTGSDVMGCAVMPGGWRCSSNSCVPNWIAVGPAHVGETIDIWLGCMGQCGRTTHRDAGELHVQELGWLAAYTNKLLNGFANSSTIRSHSKRFHDSSINSQ